jgi:hypothetical protein
MPLNFKNRAGLLASERDGWLARGMGGYSERDGWRERDEWLYSERDGWLA